LDYDVIVIGAGASGLVAAIAAARKRSRVLVIEHKDRAGRKIAATGNGKCNYTNLVQRPECYRSDDADFPMRVLSHFGLNDTIAFFEELGIVPKERDGYLYPYSEQSSSVVQVLLMECERLNISFIYNTKVVRIDKPSVSEGAFAVYAEDVKEPGKKAGYNTARVILATGGCASPKLGSDGSGYKLARNLGHSIIKPLPALVQLKSDEKYLKAVSGVRVIAHAAALSQGRPFAGERGEIIFTDYGISGIPIMQISRFIAKKLDAGKEVSLVLDFMPDVLYEDVKELLDKRLKRSRSKNLKQMMVGLLNNKLSGVIIKQARLNPEAGCMNLSFKDMERLALTIKQFGMRITDTNSFDNAQATAGGIPTGEIDDNTMESKTVKGLYIAGELIDVDGTCGGYNLQWAWSTGYLAGSAAGDISQ
jgi:predicted Rossmann fold flavoprotein